LAASHPVDAVVVDLGLPDMDGSEVIAGLRGWTDVPILVLSARDQSRQKVAALDAGADDYVVKPFGMDELLARLRAAIRRGTSAPVQPTITTGDFTIDLSAGRVTAGGQDVRLTPTEWHLLEVLARNPGKVLNHDRLLTEVWGPAYRQQTNYLRVYMATLRRKLEPDAAHPRHLLTEAGRGYRFEP
jgi:two-component system KDP operon response regulator KdpE